MGLFNLRKKKDEGWDEDAAVEFHSKAPPAPIPEVTVATVGGTQKANSEPKIPSDETAVGDLPAESSPAEDSAVEDSAADNSAVQETDHPNDDDNVEVAPAPDQAEARPSVVFATPIVSGGDQDDHGHSPDVGTPVERPSKAPLAPASMQQHLENFSREADEAVLLGKGLTHYLSDLLPVVQDLNAELADCQKEGTRLTDKLTSLRSALDALEANGPTVDTTLRELVDNLNNQLSNGSVDGVERVDVPEYSDVSELYGIISMTGDRFSQMMPALEMSRDGALRMLQTLKPDSSMFAPTKELVDFSNNGIDGVKRFMDQVIELKDRLSGSAKNYDLVSERYWKTLAESEVNLARISEVVESLKGVIESFHQSGDRLRKILSH